MSYRLAHGDEVCCEDIMLRVIIAQSYPCRTHKFVNGSAGV